MRPGIPSNRKASRQDETTLSSATIRRGVSAPPQRAASHRTPWARTRSSFGSQAEKALPTVGKDPDSPAP